MGDVRAVLRAFAAKQVTTDQVMRFLMAHDEWYAPAGLFFGTGSVGADGAEHIEVPGGEVVVFSHEGPAADGVLRLFSDREAAERARARGQTLGVYGSRVPAAAIFESIPERYEKIKINDHGPLEEFWFIGKDAFDLTSMWARAAAIERALAASPDLGAVAERMARFEHYLICVRGDQHGVIALPDFEGYQAAAVVMTAPDCRDRFLAALPPALRAELRNAWGSGSSVFTYIAMDRTFDAVVFNPAGPAGPVAVPRAEIVRVANAAPTDRIDIKLST